VTQDEIKKLAGTLKQAEKLLEDIGTTSLEGVNANNKRALIAIHQALFNLGEEDRER
jgi:hypothetical protein